MVNKNRQYHDDYIDRVLDLSSEDEEKLTRISDILTKRFNAEASKESQLKWRILFQRTARDMLPFVIYCLTFGPVAYFSLAQISKISGQEFYFLLGALLVIMILPIFVLPRLPFKWNSKSIENDTETKLPFNK